MKNKEYHEKYHKDNPYTRKKPCIKCGNTERYPTPPYQCKACQRSNARKRHVTLATLD